MTDTVTTDISAPEASPPEWVHICIKCGRGFPAWINVPAVAYDNQFRWWIGAADSPGLPLAQSEQCGGKIVRCNREVHIKNVSKALFEIALKNKMNGPTPPPGAQS